MSMLSARWHRVSNLSPRLIQTIKVQRQIVRGERWYVLSTGETNRSVRLSAMAYRFAARLDGAVTMQQLWSLAHEVGVEVSQDEAVDMLVQLHDAGLLHGGQLGSRALRDAQQGSLRSERRANPLSWRVPLGNPSALLSSLRVFGGVFFSPAGLVIWGGTMVALLMLLVQQASPLGAYAATWLTDTSFLLLATAMYIPIKLVHELAHGLAVHRWGGHVREAGVTFMLLFPVPYVNASAANGFPRRRHRAVVSAAGIAAELMLAAIALAAWTYLDDGLARQAAFATLVICGVSTLVFNANPLQRLDGYYIVCDALELPNLASRSQLWWRNVLARRLMAVPGLDAMQVAARERFWLALYSPASWMMGWVIAIFAVSWAGRFSYALGVGLAAVLAWRLLLRPLWQLLRWLHSVSVGKQRSVRRWRWVSVAIAAAAALLLMAPVPRFTMAEGVVWPPDDAQLRVEEAGFVAEVLVADGKTVGAGDAVLRLVSPQLSARHAQQAARIAALEAELLATVPGDAAVAARTRGGDARAELNAAQAAMLQMEERQAVLTLRASSSGRIAFAQKNDLTGQFLRRGTLLGQILQDTPAHVRVALPQGRADTLRAHRGAVEVRLASVLGEARSASIVRDTGGALMQLPSAALGTNFGGAVLTDPADKEHLKTLSPVVVLDVRLAPMGEGDNWRIGERAWVRFDTGSAPVAVRLADVARRLVQERFNPQF